MDTVNCSGCFARLSSKTGSTNPHPADVEHIGHRADLIYGVGLLALSSSTRKPIRAGLPAAVRIKMTFCSLLSTGGSRFGGQQIFGADQVATLGLLSHRLPVEQGIKAIPAAQLALEHLGAAADVLVEVATKFNQSRLGFAALAGSPARNRLWG